MNVGALNLLTLRKTTDYATFAAWWLCVVSPVRVSHLVLAVTLEDEMWSLGTAGGESAIERVSPGSCSRPMSLRPGEPIVIYRPLCLRGPVQSSAVGGFPTPRPQGHSSLQSVSDQGQLLLSDGLARSPAWPSRFDFSSKMAFE